jgi:hypothetical protein
MGNEDCLDKSAICGGKGMKFKPAHLDRKFFLWIGSALGILIIAFGTVSPLSAHAQDTGAGMPAAAPSSATFTLDNVMVSVQAASLPSADFIASEAGSASQVATSVAWNPFREFSITAIPFGTRSGTENLPVAEAGAKSDYENALRDFRIQQGGTPQAAPSISLFGQTIAGSQTLVDLDIDGSVPSPVVINEWVVEAGSRIWIIRWSEQQSTGINPAQSGDSPTGLVLSSDTLDHPSSVDQQPVENPGTSNSNQSAQAANLPTPAWWKGDCDHDTYSAGSGGIAPYRLGGVYLGVPACGPRPYYDSKPDVLVHFYSGAWGEYEWECVEYAMRYLYLAYAISPYSANGSQVVSNYSGSKLVKIANGTYGQAPRPGDVLSYGATSSSGHTSVVSSSSVDTNGNGTIVVAEENASVTGSSTLQVQNWSVLGNAGSVSGWLHNAAASPVKKVRDDYDGDGKTDPAKFDPATGIVWWLKSSTGTWDGKWLGSDAYYYVDASDFDGDGKTDPAKFYPATGTVWWVNSSTGTVGGQWQGGDTYQYISGSDFDGDGKTDPAKFYPATGTVWWVNSTTGKVGGQWQGGDSFQYVSGSDFDGDGKTDPAKFYPATGTVWWVRSSDGKVGGQWLGGDSFQYVPASDFDGDGKTDPAKFYPATGTVWWVRSSDGQLAGAWLGPGSYTYIAGDDFNGDGKTDPAKYDASTHRLSWLNVSTGIWTDVDMGTGTFTVVNGQ